MGLRERINLFIEFKGINKVIFERLANLSNGFVDKAGDNTRKSSLDKISNAFPELNVSWLRTGEGKMTKDVDFLKESDSSSKEVKILMDKIKELELSIKEKDAIIKSLSIALENNSKKMPTADTA